MGTKEPNWEELEKEFSNGFDFSNANGIQLNKWIIWKQHEYESDNLVDTPLWEAFKYEWKGFSSAILQHANAKLLRGFRNDLLNRGLWMDLFYANSRNPIDCIIGVLESDSE